MKHIKHTIGLLLLATVTAVAQGQPEKNVGSVEIDVIDQYKASVKKASKISSQPDFADTTTKKLPVNYRIFSEMLQFKFTPEPITPVKVQGVRLGKLPKNTIKLGAGMYGASLAEILLSSSRAEAFNWEIGLQHNGASKGVNGIVYDKSPFMENTLYLGGRWLLKDYRLKAQVGVDWNRFHFYGIADTTSENTLAIPDLQKNDYQRYFGVVTFDRIYRKEKSPFQSLSLGYHHMANNWQTAEHLMQVKSAWQLPKAVEKHILGAGLNVDWQSTKSPQLIEDINQFNLQFFPKAKGTYAWFGYTLGLNFNFYSLTQQGDSTTTSDFRTYFYPEIAIEAELVRDVLAFFAGWTGDVTMNGQYSLTQQNPFVLPALQPLPTGAQKIYAGLEGAIARNIAYKAEANIRFVNGLPLFYRSGDSVTVPFGEQQLPAFNVQYTRGSMASVRGEVAYHTDKTRISAYGEVFSYNLKVDEQKVNYHLPTARIGVDVLQVIKDKFEIKTGLAYVGGRNALIEDGTAYSAAMKDIWDVHLALGYNVNNNLSAGLEFANLASQGYEVWLGYPVQRFRALLFLRYSF